MSRKKHKDKADDINTSSGCSLATSGKLWFRDWARSGICCVLIALQLIFLPCFCLTNFWTCVNGWHVAELHSSAVSADVWGPVSLLLLWTHLQPIPADVLQLSEPCTGLPAPHSPLHAPCSFIDLEHICLPPSSNIARLMISLTEDLQPFSPIPIPVLLCPLMFSEKLDCNCLFPRAEPRAVWRVTSLRAISGLFPARIPAGELKGGKERWSRTRYGWFLLCSIRLTLQLQCLEGEQVQLN